MSQRFGMARQASWDRREARAHATDLGQEMPAQLRDGLRAFQAREKEGDEGSRGARWVAAWGVYEDLQAAAKQGYDLHRTIRARMKLVAETWEKSGKAKAGKAQSDAILAYQEAVFDLAQWALDALHGAPGWERDGDVRT